MALEELRKICDEATSGAPEFEHDLVFYNTARTMMPKLVVVAEAATKFMERWTEAFPHVDAGGPTKVLLDALAELEKEIPK